MKRKRGFLHLQQVGENDDNDLGDNGKLRRARQLTSRRAATLLVPMITRDRILQHDTKSRETHVCTVVAHLCWVDFSFVTSLPAGFCLVRWEFGRT